MQPDVEANGHPLPEGRPGPVGGALRNRAADYCLDLAAPTACAWHPTALQHGCRSVLAVPLMNDEELLGVLVLCGPAPLPAAPTAEIALIQEVVDNLAFAVSARRASRACAEQEKSLYKAVPGLSAPAGQQFFEHILGSLSNAWGCNAVVLTRFVSDAPGRARVLAGFVDGSPMPTIEFDMSASFRRQLMNASSVVQAGPLTELYPDAVILRDLLRGCDSAVFIGHRLDGSRGQLLACFA